MYYSYGSEYMCISERKESLQEIPNDMDLPLYIAIARSSKLILVLKSEIGSCDNDKSKCRLHMY